MQQPNSAVSSQYHIGGYNYITMVKKQERKKKEKKKKKGYSHQVKFSHDRSSVRLVESREERYTNAISDNFDNNSSV